MPFRSIILLLAIAAAVGGVLMTNFSSESVAAETIANPIAEEWGGPYGGVPPFDKIKVADFKPALEAAMAEQLAEVEAIANHKEAPTFENTIAALERSGKTLDRVTTIYGIWSSNMNSDEFGKVEAEMDPKLAAHGDKITQNEALFKRIETVYNSPDKKKLTPEQQRLAWVYYTTAVRQGAKLDPAKKAWLSEINQSLAGLFTKFSQNLLGDESQLSMVITNEADLAGLSPALKSAGRFSREGQRKGRLDDPQHAFVGRSVPYVFGSAEIFAKRRVGCSSIAETMVTNETITPPSRR